MGRAAYGMEHNVLRALVIMHLKLIQLINNVNKSTKFAWQMVKDVHIILDAHLLSKKNIVYRMVMAKSAFGMVNHAFLRIAHKLMKE